MSCLLLLVACAVDDSVQPNLPSCVSAAGAGHGAAGSSAAGPSAAGGAAGTSGAGGGSEAPGGAAGNAAGNVAPDGGELGSGGVGGSEVSSAAQDADCDLNGIWIARLLNVAEAIGLEQCGSTYEYFELKHEGADVEVASHLHCGIEARGSSSGTMNDATRAALMGAVSQVGRRGTMTKGSDGTCQLHLERHWTVIGVDPAKYAPSPSDLETPFTEVQATNPLPTSAEQAIDVDNDGQPGIAIIVTGVIAGTRHNVQRNSHAVLTNDRYRIMPSLDWSADIEARADYFAEEIVLAVRPEDAALLASPSNMVPSAPSARLTLRFLGRHASDPRVAPIVVSTDPGSDGALQTCQNIIAALPPVEAISDGLAQVCPCPGGAACL